MKHYLHIQHKIHKYTDNIHYKGCKLKGRKAKKYVCTHCGKDFMSKKECQ